MSGLLVVLGKNIGVGSTPEDIRRDPDYLSIESRISVVAAGVVYLAAATQSTETEILFSTGHTAGDNVPSEAAAMKTYFEHRYPDVPKDHLRTEEVSIDTATNALEVAKLLHTEPRSWDKVDLMSVGFHVANAAKLFRRNGVPINRTFASDEIIREQSEAGQRYIQNWFGSDRIQKEIRKEQVRSILLSTIDRRGKLLHAVTQRSRG